jgi:hypothetical protein
MHGANNVSEDIARDALAAVAVHPMYAEAIGWEHHASDVFSRSKDFIDRARMSDGQRSSLREDLADVSSVLIVTYWTSDKKPEALSGSGKLYTFLLHPKTFAVLGADVGGWRS